MSDDTRKEERRRQDRRSHDRRSEDKVEGEGSYSATKAYDRATRAFVKSGRVEESAEEAKRAYESPAARREMEAAERAGKAKARGEDPELSRKAAAKPGQRGRKQ